MVGVVELAARWLLARAARLVRDVGEYHDETAAGGRNHRAWLDGAFA